MNTVTTSVAAVAAAVLLAPVMPTPAAAASGEWGAWESLGGTVRLLPDCHLQGRTIDCWALGTGSSSGAGSNVMWLRGDGETWAPWENLGGAFRAAPECVSRGGETDCFATEVLAVGSELGHITYDGQEWGTWESLGGLVKQKPDCVTEAGQRITCVALATDDSGWWYYHFDGQEWAPAARLDFPAGVKSTLRPGCVDTPRGTECFMVDTTRRLWATQREQDGTWSDWVPLATGIAEPPYCLATGAKLDCFSRSVTSRLISASFNGDSWSQWTEIGDPTVQSQPYCNKLGSGFDCYWTSPDNELRRRQRDHAVWLPEEDLGGNVRARPACVATPGGQRIDCFAEGPDNTLHHLAYD